MPLFHLSVSFVPKPQSPTRAGSADPLSGVKLFPCFTCGTLGRTIGTKEGEGVRRCMEKWGTLIMWDADLWKLHSDRNVLSKIHLCAVGRVEGY